MTLISAAPIVEKTSDKAQVIAELARRGIEISSAANVTVGYLYRLVCQAEKRGLPDSGATWSTPSAQWIFLRRWLADRANAVAAPRAIPEFRPYSHPPQMREALARCREHAACRRAGEDASA